LLASQFGSVAVAYWNLCLAVTTFFLLVVRYQPPKYVKWIVFANGIVFDVVSPESFLVCDAYGDRELISGSSHDRQLMTVIGPAQNKSPFSFFGKSFSSGSPVQISRHRGD
jgi:hypothetical protein